MNSFAKLVLASFLIYFSSSFILYKLGINKLYTQSEDTIPAMFLPVTILKEQTLYADTYYKTIRARYPNPDDKSFEKGFTPFYFRSVINCQTAAETLTKNTSVGCGPAHYISAFPILTGLLGIPIFLTPLLLGMSVNFGNLSVFAHITSSLIVALSGGFLYLLLKKHFSLNEKTAVLFVLIYLFGTVNFAMLSQSLWQHGTLELFLILGLFFLYEYINTVNHAKYNLFLSSFMIGLAVLSRPTAILVIPFLFFIYIFKDKIRLERDNMISTAVFLAGFLPSLLFFLWYNKTYYVSVLNQGYSKQIFVDWLSPFPQGFLGVWISPSKGILTYSPVFIFSLIGFYLAFKKENRKEYFDFIIFGVIVILHTLIVSKWKHWYGGYSYGYRMSSDILPFLILLLVPYVKSNLYEKTKKIFFILFGVSVFIELLGIVFFDGVWHAAYDRGYIDTSWLWSIKNSEFVFNVRRVLVKLKLIKKACEQCL